MSCIFEGLELSLQHVLPNFAECWWDRCVPRLWSLTCRPHTTNRWVVDTVCNLVGIACGMWLLRAWGLAPHTFLRPPPGARGIGPTQMAKFLLVLAMFLAFDLLTFFTKVGRALLPDTATCAHYVGTTGGAVGADRGPHRHLPTACVGVCRGTAGSGGCIQYTHRCLFQIVAHRLSCSRL